jgi:hypothetical protein
VTERIVITATVLSSGPNPNSSWNAGQGLSSWFSPMQQVHFAGVPCVAWSSACGRSPNALIAASRIRVEPLLRGGDHGEPVAPLLVVALREHLHVLQPEPVAELPADLLQQHRRVRLAALRSGLRLGFTGEGAAIDSGQPRRLARADAVVIARGMPVIRVRDPVRLQLMSAAGADRFGSLPEPQAGALGSASASGAA